jgi:transcriptional regulator with XRE-family HTH domain
MSTCSRCGTTTGQHTVKCLQAMALAWAMGVEERPSVPGAATVTELREEIGQLGVLRRALGEAEAQNNEQSALIGQLRAQLDRERVGASQLEDELTRLRAQLASLQQQAPATQLPPDYYEARVSAARLAEIQAEVEALNTLREMAASPHLDVRVTDGRNAVVTPRRDDDYTPEAVDRTVAEDEAPPAPPVDAAPAAEQEAPAEEPAAPEPEPSFGQRLLALRHARGWTQTQAAIGLNTSSSMVSYYEMGRYQPSDGIRARLAELEAEPQPEPTPRREPQPEPAPAPEPASTTTTRPWKEENAAKIGVPGAWAKPETTALEESCRRYVTEHLLPTPHGAMRTDDAGREWNTYVLAPELLAGYQAYAERTGAPLGKPMLMSRFLGNQARSQVKDIRQGPRLAGAKPNAYFGVQLVDQAAEQPEPEPEPPLVEERRRDLTERERRQADVDELRALMAQTREVKTEHVPEPDVQIPHGPDELAVKLAQLKHFGIGGEHGVDRVAAQAAVGRPAPHRPGRVEVVPAPDRRWRVRRRPGRHRLPAAGQVHERAARGVRLRLQGRRAGHRPASGRKTSTPRCATRTGWRSAPSPGTGRSATRSSGSTGATCR